MKTKHSFMTKSLSVFLSAVMLLTMISVGFIFPETATKASAATYTANSVATLNSAIASANSAGSSVTTTIQLSGDISTTGAQSALTEITGNVILDFNGHNISFKYSGDGSGSNSTYQLPSENAGSNHNGANVLTKGMLNVGTSGKLQLINTSGTASTFTVDTYFGSNNNSKQSNQTSSTAIYSKGTVVFGDKNNSGNNNFTLFSQSRCATANKDGYKARTSYANAYGVIIDDADNGKFFMYGGTLQSSALCRGNNDGDLIGRCFSLDLNACYSAEIYGGSINIASSDESGHRNSSSYYNTSGGESFFAAIRTCTSNLYIFNVSSSVYAYQGSDTKGSNLRVYNILTNNTAIPHIYGGNFVNTADLSSKNDQGTLCVATLEGETEKNGLYQIANGTVDTGTAWNASDPRLNFAYTASDSSGSQYNINWSISTIMYFGDSKSNSTTTQEGAGYNDGVYPWSYATFRDYLAALPSLNDLYKGDCGSHIDDGASYSLDLGYKYRRVGYTQTGWYGSFDVGTENGNVVNGQASGTLFAYPKWSTNTYTITYDLNDQNYSSGSYNYSDTVSNVSGFNTTKTYTIESTNCEFGTPVRHGYTFNGWKVTAISYAEKDAYSSTSPWGRGVIHYGTTKVDGKYGNLSLQAQWTIDTNTITYDMNGADQSISQDTYTVEDTVTIPSQTITKNYYDFKDQWQVVSSSGSWTAGNKYGIGTVIARGSYGDVTLTPVYEPHTYTVTYDSDGGSNVDDANLKTYNIESTTTLPAVTKTGYNFVGWQVVSVDTAGAWTKGTPYVTGTSFNGKYGNVTLKAIWEVQTFTVTFNLQADENYGTTSFNYKYDTAYPLTTQPTKTGYSFAGWKVESKGSGATWTVGTVYAPDAITGTVTIPANMQGDVTLRAQWTPVTYNITFNTNGGSAVSSISYTIEDTIALSASVKSGYTFGGWQVSGSTTGNWSGQYAATTLTNMYGEVTLVAIWTPVTYTVTLDTDGGSLGTQPSTMSYDIEADEADRKLPVPTKTGYEFTGWEVTATDTVNSSWVTAETYTDYLPSGKYGNATLTARWKAVSYTISYSTIGNAITSKSFTIEDSFTLPSSDCPGYTFDNWTVTTANGNWTANQVISTSDTISGRYGDAILTANFTPVTYTLTYKYADGKTKEVSYNITDSVNLDTYTYGGYTFSNWKVESCEGGNWYTDAVFSAGAVEAGQYGNVTLVPVLEANTYVITFDSDGGTAYANRSYKITDDTALPVPAKTGYDFSGWKVTSADGNWTADEVLATDATVADRYGNVTLTAQWTAKTYTITWETGSGTYTTTAAYGTTPAPSSDVKTAKAADAQYYYNFANEWTPAITTVTGDATYTAKYNCITRTYKVTWVVETDESGTTSTTTKTYQYGATPVYNNGATPAKTSTDPDDHVWRFTGWSPAVSTVTGDVTYTAQFKSVAAPRIVTWVIDGVESDSYYEVGETPDYGSTPYKEPADGYDYQFSNWTPSIVPVAANTDYIYEAVFTPVPRTYTATFDANGGTLYSDEAEYTIATGLTLPTPTRNGYNFTGWTVTKATGTWTKDASYAGGEEVTGNWGNITLTAQWELATYTVTYTTAEGTAPAALTYTTESTDVLTACTREGYEMTAYVVSAGNGSWTVGTSVSVGTALTGKYGDVTLTPIWNTKTYTVTWVSGDTVQTTSVQYGSAISVIDPIAKTGYNAEWAETIPETMPAEDLTFNAVYTLINYNVRVLVNGGDAIDSFTYNIESTSTLPTPTREGSVFKGWKVTIASGNWTKNEIKDAGYPLNGKYGNITITAQWELVTHTVTFIAGDVTKVTKWYHGSTPFYSGTPTKASDEYNSYVFSGWDKPFTEVTEDTTYTALFTPTERVYTVTWNVDNDIITQEYKYGETPAYPGATPTKAETDTYTFTFAGWDKEIAPVTGDITYFVQWNIFTKLLGLRLDSTAEVLNIGDTASLNATIYPATASVKDIVWKSQDTGVAEISDGKITATGTGTTLVQVSSVDGNFNAYCVVVVNATHTTYVAITSNGISTTNLPGTAVQLYATVMPDNATNVSTVWTSSDPSVASVSSTGLVTYNRVGTATITCVAADGYARGSIDVTVTQDETQVVDEVKTYLVMFNGSACGFVIDGVTYDKINVRVEEGGSIQFKLEENKYCQIDGEYYRQGSDGYYRITDIHDNHLVTNLEENIAIPDEEISENVDTNKSFFQRLQDFFRRIVQWFRSLFGGK